MKELERRIGQVVAYIKTHEQDKLNPLLESLFILTKQMEDTIAKVPKAQRFEDVIKNISNLLASQDQKHQKQVGLITQSQDQVKNETADTIKKLTASLNELRSEQQKIKEVIDTKLGKKYF